MIMKCKKSEYKSGIEREKGVELFICGRKIIIQYKLGLNKYFTNKIFAPQKHGERKRLKFQVIIQENIF